jgi:hypothetical protein
MKTIKGHSTGTKIKAKLGFHNVKDPDVLAALNAVYTGMKGNASYPNPPVDLAVFKTAIDSYTVLITDAQDGGKKANSAKNKQRVAAIKMYTQLGHYVEAACNDDPAVFTTSGFKPAPKGKAAQQPLAPAKFSSIDRGAISGQTVVRVARQKGAIIYEVRHALVGSGGALGSWTTLTLTSPKKVIINGLTPAGTYQFQVRALGKLGYTDWSESMTFISA